MVTESKSDDNDIEVIQQSEYNQYSIYHQREECSWTLQDALKILWLEKGLLDVDEVI